MSNANLLCLPIEVLYNIFDKIDTYTIYHSIGYVCKYLYETVNNYQAHKLVFSSGLSYNFKRIFDLCRPELLISLHISNGENDKTIKQCISHIGNRRLIRLRYLYLHGIDDEEMKYFLENLLPDTLILLSVECRYFRYSVNLIFPFINKLNLKKLYLFNFNDITENQLWSKHESIEHLTINSCVLRYIPNIFNCMPKLKQLVIDECRQEYDRAILSPSHFIVQPQLISFSITDCRLGLYDIESLLSFLPSIHHLKLIMKCHNLISAFDGEYWQNLISTKLPLLKNFEFSFLYEFDEGKYSRNLDEQLASFQTAYWLDKHWFVTCEYNINTRELKIYKSDTKFIHKKYLTKTELTLLRLEKDTSPIFKYSTKDNIYQLTQPNQNNQIVNTIEFSYNNFKNNMHHVRRVLETNKNLINLSLRSCGIDENGIQSIAIGLKNNQTLKSLNLFGNSLKHRAADYLSNALENNSTLITLELVATYIHPAVVNGLKNNTTLKTLILNTNDINEYSITYLVEFLKVNQTLTELQLIRNKLETRGAILLADGLKMNKGLIELSLSYNDIGPDAGQYIGDALRENQTLRILVLGCNKLGSEGIKGIANGLQSNQTLIQLGIRMNNIGSDGGKYIGDILTNNQTLQILDLVHNDIGIEGMRLIADGLKNNHSITTLDLSQTRIGSQGTAYLADALKQNTTLTHLTVRHNGLSTIGTEYLADALKHNKTLIMLDLNGTSMQCTGARHLASALEINTTLTELILFQCRIGDDGALHLAKALSINKTLKLINLENDNPMTKKGIQFLIDVVENKKEPITITLSTRIITNCTKSR